jgi:MFS family permease
MRGVRHNIWKIYAFKFLGDFLMIVPIILPFYKACGLTVTQFLIAQAVFSAGALVLEIPSGYLADALGRKRALVLGAAFFPAGLALYALSSSFAAFCCAELILAASASLRSGTDSALVFDSLRELGREREYERVEGRARLFERLGTAISSIGGGLLALVSLRLPLYVNAAAASLLLLSSFLFVEPARVERRARSPVRDMLSIAARALAERRTRRLALFQALLLCSGILGIWLAFLYYGALRLGPAWCGALFFAFQLLAGLSSDRAHALERPIGRRLVPWALLLVGPSFLALGLATSPWLVPLVLINACLWGASTPIVLDRMNRLVDSEIRATVLSVSGMVSRAFLVVCFPIFGAIVDRVSVSAAFLALGAAVIALGVPLALALGRERESVVG